MKDVLSITTMLYGSAEIRVLTSPEVSESNKGGRGRDISTLKMKFVSPNDNVIFCLPSKCK